MVLTPPDGTVLVNTDSSLDEFPGKTGKTLDRTTADNNMSRLRDSFIIGSTSGGGETVNII